MACGDERPQLCTVYCCPCCMRMPCACAPAPQFTPTWNDFKLSSFSQAGHALTDADVERVARRVVEMLGERLK